MTTELKVTAQGVWIPRSLLDAWEDVEEVEIEQRDDALIIKPKPNHTDPTQDSIVREMKAEGLIETLPWEHPPTVSADERARLAKQLSFGKPLSTVILESREAYA
jgi:antitoxin component of MazEF toxin-antitoxin module